GGQEAGEWASKLAIEALTEAVRAYADQMNQGKRVVGLSELLERAFALAQRRVVREPGRKGMATTLTALLLQDWNREGRVAHLGDSRAYRIGPEGVRQITQDHTWVAEQVRLGLLSPEEAKRHPFRNLLTRAIGLAAHEAKPDLYPLRLLPGEGVVLATDGFYTAVPEEGWRFGRNLQADLEALAALARGGRDNLTALAIREEA
ncbi:MAG: PP2C family protein-serine/threonine phosphatase, partial [Thermaceae bacterium]